MPARRPHRPGPRLASGARDDRKSTPEAPSPQRAPAVVRLENATRTFDDVRAANRVSLEVDQGTILGLIGPSGSGKTTIVRMLTGSLAPTGGRVRVLGEDPTRYR